METAETTIAIRPGYIVSYHLFGRWCERFYTSSREAQEHAVLIKQCTGGRIKDESSPPSEIFVSLISDYAVHRVRAINREAYFYVYDGEYTIHCRAPVTVHNRGEVWVSPTHAIRLDGSVEIEINET